MWTEGGNVSQATVKAVLTSASNTQHCMHSHSVFGSAFSSFRDNADVELNVKSTRLN